MKTMLQYFKCFLFTYNVEIGRLSFYLSFKAPQSAQLYTYLFVCLYDSSANIAAFICACTHCAGRKQVFKILAQKNMTEKSMKRPTFRESIY